MKQTTKIFSMSKSHLTRIIAVVGATAAFASAFIGVASLAQTTTTNYGLADWEFTPAQGATAPLFRSTTDTVIKLKNLKTNDIVVPADGQFTCKIEARAFQPKSGTAAWISVANNVAYSAANGCSGTFTKAQRGNGLNWSIRTTVTRVNDSTKVYEFFNSYAYTFQGAGVASGN